MPEVKPDLLFNVYYTSRQRKEKEEKLQLQLFVLVYGPGVQETGTTIWDLGGRK